MKLLTRGKIPTLSQWLRHSYLGIIVVLFFSVAAYSLGYLADFYRGEDFLLFYPAETYPFTDAVRLFFLEHGRFFEGVWWLGLYKLTSYQPALQHFISLVLNVVAAAMASLVFYRATPVFQKLWFASGFILVAFFNPFATSWSLILSGDNSRISLILFFAAALFFQNWLLNGFKFPWMFFGVLCFVLAAFNYESVIFMFPAIVLLLLFMDAPGLIGNKKASRSLGLAFLVSLLAPLLSYFIYRHFEIVSHPALRGDGAFSSLFERLFDTVFYTFYLLGISGSTLFQLSSSTSILPLALLALFLAMSVVAINAKSEHRYFAWLVFLALWLSYVSVFTYAFAYLNGALYVRFYALLVYGFALLGMLTIALAPWRPMKIAALVVIVFVSGFGLVEFVALAVDRNQTETRPEFDYLSLVTLVPRVEEGAHFVLVDDYLGTSPYRSCALALRMLYSDASIGCVYVSDQAEPIYAERWPDALNSHEGGWIRNEKFIIVGRNEDGSRYIIPEINPASSVDIEWHDTTPIRTDFSAFQQNVEPLPTGMLQKLRERELKVIRD